MDSFGRPLFKFIDCVELYVPNLQDGIEYYQRLGLKVLWKTDAAVGLAMDNSTSEIVLQNERPGISVDVKVQSVVDAVGDIEKAGGRIVYGPFDIRIGKCAVVEDPWGNRHVILDTSKGTYITDEEGNIVGQNPPS